MYTIKSCIICTIDPRVLSRSWARRLQGHPPPRNPPRPSPPPPGGANRAVLAKPRRSKQAEVARLQISNHPLPNQVAVRPQTSKVGARPQRSNPSRPNQALAAKLRMSNRVEARAKRRRSNLPGANRAEARHRMPRRGRLRAGENPAGGGQDSRGETLRDHTKRWGQDAGRQILRG